MTSAITAAACCCAGGQCLSDCIFGTETNTGCCHKADTLLLWCDRPGYTTRQHFSFGGCETCFTETVSQMSPVQAIYHYHSCRFRFVYAQGDPVTLVNMSPTHLPVADDTFGQGEACANPVCETDPAYCPDVCCGVQIPSGSCLCNTWYGAGIGGLSQWRYDQILGSDENLWFGEMTCHKSGNPLDAANGVDRLGYGALTGFLCLVFFERWWRIPEGCAPEARIYVPGCTQSPEGSNCGGIPFQSDDLVPRWWIFACSGIPLYQFELDEALEFGIIDAAEYDDIVDKIANGLQPPQPPLFKMARAGYLAARDWRAEQRQAFIDLDANFPGAGYAACIEPLDDMAELGPFRKRFTAPRDLNVARPWLHKDDVVPELAPFQADCMIDYPGSWSNGKDYQYWRERQWVYYRGVPGGWAWGAWDVSEEQLAEGIGRNVGTGDPITLLSSPMNAFRGEPRPPSGCQDCGPGICPEATYCSMCVGGVLDPGACPECGNAPVAACNPPIQCLRFNVVPYCEGVHFIFSAYVFENDLDPVEGGCVADGRYRCHYQVHSFLVEARRSVDSWNDSIPWRCRTESPPLPVWNDWPSVSRAHFGVSTMCNEIVNPQNNPPIYVVGDLCCGGTCADTEDVYYDWPTAPSGCPTVGPGGSEGPYPCPIPGPTDPCDARHDCPPHDTPAQIGCIGHEIDCDPTP